MSTYQPIASVTLSSAQSSVTFSGIPQTYTDLVVVFTTNTAVNSRAIRFRMNGDTSANYSYTQLYGTGSAAGSSRSTSTTYIGLMENGGTDNTANNYQPVKINIMNYSNTTTNKTVLVRQDGKAETAAVVGLYRSTSAITSLTLELTDNSNWSSGNTFNLYGVANASITNVAKATGGDSVYTDGTYWYHIFRSSGTFTPTQALTADYLVVAGGASGGTKHGGGGAAGGFLTSTTSFSSNTSFTITVGAGGAAQTSQSANGINGNNSVISGTGLATITSTGGGYGGAGGQVGGTGQAGGNGGSGGGGGADSTGGAGGSASPSGQGNNGGAGGVPLGERGGGGGGAGAAGATGVASGNGGAGSASSISGSSVTYAGGGGGGSRSDTTAGAGGSGGGGAGSNTDGTSGVAGTVNTGGGGGGGGRTYGSGNGSPSGAGGSGIVIVRYAA